MLPYRDSRLVRIFLIVFFLALVGYTYFEAQGVLFGPRIALNQTETTVTEPFVFIKGKAERMVKLTMNGAEIPVTESGEFEQGYLLAEGANIIDFEAEDRSGRAARERLVLVFAPPPGSYPSMPHQVGTSTATSSSTASPAGN